MDGAIRWQILRSVHQRYIFYFCAISHRFRDIRISYLWSWKRRSRSGNTKHAQFDDNMKIFKSRNSRFSLAFSISKILSCPNEEVGQSHEEQLSQWCHSIAFIKSANVLLIFEKLRPVRTKLTEKLTSLGRYRQTLADFPENCIYASIDFCYFCGSKAHAL